MRDTLNLDYFRAVCQAGDDAHARGRHARQIGEEADASLVRLALGRRRGQIELGDFQPGQELQVDFSFECWLTPQQYTLTVATQNADGSSHDWLDDVVAFDVVDTRSAAGVSNLRASVTWRATHDPEVEGA